MAQEMCATLHACGAQVIGPVSDIDCGRVLMDRQPLDCAVLDVNLLGKSVFPLASELRARGIATIFATGYDSDLLPLAFRDSVYLQKPIDLAALIEAVKRCARRLPTPHN
jgi:DNA-binding response OmpR family regulator